MSAVRFALVPFRLLRRLPGPVRIAVSPAGPFLLLLLLWAGRAFLSLPAIDNTSVLLPATDGDALRLTHVQELASGLAHDHVLHQVAPPHGLVPAFSALVDKVQAILLKMLMAHQIADVEARQLFMLSWPQILAFVAGLGLVILALALGGTAGGHVAAVLAVLIPDGPFAAGRLDDTGMQLVLFLPALALLTRALMRSSTAAAGAGGVLLALAFMLMPFSLLPVVAAIILFTAYLYVSVGRIMRPVAFGTGLGLATGGALGHVAETVARQADLTAVACDATGLNWALAAILAGLALAVAGVCPHRWQRGWKQRLGLVVPLLALAPLTFTVLEPACLKGPSGLADPQALHLLAQEQQSAPSLVQRIVDPAFWLSAAWATAAMTIAFVLAYPRKAETPLAGSLPPAREVFLRNIGSRQALALVTAAALALELAALWDARWSQATLWLAAGMLAAGTGQALSQRHRHSLTRPVVIFLPAFLSPLSLQLALTAAPPFHLADIATKMREAWLRPVHDHGSDRKHFLCLKTLLSPEARRIQTGLVVAPVRFGASILMVSQRPVLAVADPRAGEALVTNARALTDIPSLARARLLTLGVSTIVFASGVSVSRPDDGRDREPGLWRHLAAHDVPPWLEPAASPHSNRHDGPAGNEEGNCGLRLFRVKANRPLPPVLEVPAILIEGIAPRKTADPIR